MNDEIKRKLNKVSDIWSSYLYQYKFFKNRIKFDSDLKTNYVGIILGYFDDTLEIIYNRTLSDTHSQNFANHISLMQIIYVHQDFIEEMLLIFRCQITKENLKQDPDYNLNRDLRNELVGHPISRSKNGELMSSCLFGYDSNKDLISYLKYHKENNHKFEDKSILVSEVINMHTNFLNKYLDIILNKLKSILEEFIIHVEKIENQVISRDFITLTNILSKCFESIFNSEYLYDVESLKNIYTKKDSHIRYKNFIDLFYKNLSDSLNEVKNDAQSFIKWKYENSEPLDISNEIFFSIVYNSESNISIQTDAQRSYSYELGKLATNPLDFDHFSYPLKENFKSDPILIEELSNMEKNMDKKIEYYCSLRLISTILKEEEF